MNPTSARGWTDEEFPEVKKSADLIGAEIIDVECGYGGVDRILVRLCIDGIFYSQGLIIQGESIKLELWRMYRIAHGEKAKYLLSSIT